MTKTNYNYYPRSKDEALKALHEASLSIACLGADWTEHFEDESVTKNHRKWVLKDQEDAFETMQSIDDEVFSTLANKFNLEVN